MCNEAKKVHTIKPYEHLILVDYVYFLKIHINHTHTLNNSMYFQPHQAYIPKISDYKRRKGRYARRGLSNELEIPEQQIR